MTTFVWQLLIYLTDKNAPETRTPVAASQNYLVKHNSCSSFMLPNLPGSCPDCLPRFLSWVFSTVQFWLIFSRKVLSATYNWLAQEFDQLCTACNNAQGIICQWGYIPGCYQHADLLPLLFCASRGSSTCKVLGLILNRILSKAYSLAYHTHQRTWTELETDNISKYRLPYHKYESKYGVPNSTLTLVCKWLGSRPGRSAVTEICA